MRWFVLIAGALVIVYCGVTIHKINRSIARDESKYRDVMDQIMRLPRSGEENP